MSFSCTMGYNFMHQWQWLEVKYQRAGFLEETCGAGKPVFALLTHPEPAVSLPWQWQHSISVPKGQPKLIGVSFLQLRLWGDWFHQWAEAEPWVSCGYRAFEMRLVQSEVFCRYKIHIGCQRLSVEKRSQLSLFCIWDSLYVEMIIFLEYSIK
jgi:hypothetical protein